VAFPQKSPSLFIVGFGVKPTLFEYILVRTGENLAKHHLDIQWKTKETSGAPRFFTPEDQLRLLFHWFKYYLSEEYLAVQLGCHQSTIHDYLVATLMIFVDTFQNGEYPSVVIPNRKLRDQESIVIRLSNGSLLRIAVVVDGSEQQIWIPSTGGE
jgi:hypothetical protein